MSYKVQLTDKFQRQAKRLIKKYPSLKKELFELRNSLLENPLIGTALGRDCYKIRLSIASKNKGKSGGARAITHVYIKGAIVYLISIYDKSEQADIAPKDLIELLKGIEK